MAAWAEEHGFTAAVVSEHHASDDGYLPSPLVVASAMAARTKTDRDQRRRAARAAVRPGEARRGHRGARPRQPRSGFVRRRHRLPARRVRVARPRLQRPGARHGVVDRVDAPGVDGRAVRARGPHGATCGRRRSPSRIRCSVTAADRARRPAARPGSTCRSSRRSGRSVWSPSTRANASGSGSRPAS